MMAAPHTLGVAVPDATIADQVADNQLGVCTVQQWRSGHCVSPPVVMDIPFSQIGEFVYHCHILEHEDGGMMAKIQVVPSPNGGSQPPRPADACAAMTFGRRRAGPGCRPTGAHR